MKGVNTYRNGNYIVMMFPDGTKVRRTNDDGFIPKFAENCDVKITDCCDGGCPFCYEGCTKEGEHADFSKYTNLIESLHPYTELALNGNDLTHPDLTKFLVSLERKKIYSNLTVNQKHFMREKNLELLRELTAKKLIYGLGISLSSPSQEFIERVKEFPNAVIHVIAGIFSKADFEALRDKGLKILILGYKNLRRGVSYRSSHSVEIEDNIKWLSENLKELTKHFSVVSFDNLAIEQLEVRGILSPAEWDEFYMGDDGMYTFYIDLVRGEFAKNSVSQERYPIEGRTVDEMFSFIKDVL